MPGYRPHIGRRHFLASTIVGTIAATFPLSGAQASTTSPPSPAAPTLSPAQPVPPPAGGAVVDAPVIGAAATFEAVGFSVTCWPSDERRYALQTFSGVRTRLAATVDWLYERAAVIEYRWRGWMR